MQRNKRRKHLSPDEKTRFDEAAQRFKKDVAPLFCSLTAFGEGYKALLTITDAIDAAYAPLEVEKPDPHYPVKTKPPGAAEPGAK